MDYDKMDPASIETHGQSMIGKSFNQIYDEAIKDKNEIIMTREDYASRHAKKAYKGGMGNLIEECGFGYRTNSSEEPDFAEAGVELKVTPYKRLKNGDYSAKERLVLTMINYMDVVKEPDFLHSHLWYKSKLLLLMWYLYFEGQRDIESTIDFVQLFTPPEKDLEVIKEDYRKIVDKVRAGKAHELSEGDTMYLGACTKGATARNRRQQPYSDIPAKPRAFSFKNSYMTYVLRDYIIPGKRTYKALEPILSADETARDFEQVVLDKIEAFKGKSQEELCKQFGLEKKKNMDGKGYWPKNIFATIAFRVLGIKNNQAEEFEKAGIVVKTYRIKNNGKMKESTSFPAFEYQKLVKEYWRTSTMSTYLCDNRFFLVVYQEDADGVLRLDHALFWHIPYEDLQEVRKVWLRIKRLIQKGQLSIQVGLRKNKQGILRLVTLQNNLPKISDSPVCHVRPHGKNNMDTYPLPSGKCLTSQKEPGCLEDWPDATCYTKQCFWLNEGYMLRQLRAKSSSKDRQ